MTKTTAKLSAIRWGNASKFNVKAKNPTKWNEVKCHSKPIIKLMNRHRRQHCIHLRSKTLKWLSFTGPLRFLFSKFCVTNVFDLSRNQHNYIVNKYSSNTVSQPPPGFASLWPIHPSSRWNRNICFLIKGNLHSYQNIILNRRIQYL